MLQALLRAFALASLFSLLACGGGGGGGTTPDIPANAAPVANAGTAQNVVAGAAVTLNGSGSSDANGDPLVTTRANLESSTHPI